MKVLGKHGRQSVAHLIQNLEDGDITESDRELLMDYMRRYPSVREMYMQHVQMAALLQESAKSRVEMGAMPVSEQRLTKEKRKSSIRTLVYGMAAMLVAGLGLMLFFGTKLQNDASQSVLVEESSDASYAVTYASPGKRHGNVLMAGDRIVVSSGLLKLTYPSGVEALIEGPSDLEVISAAELAMHGGLGWFRVPPEGSGFTVITDRTSIIDYGTEFGLQFDLTDELQVHVAKGHVGVDPHIEGLAEISLRANEALSMDVSGKIRKIPFSADAFQTRFSKDLEYIHWSFDKLVDGAFPADGPLADSVDGAARLMNAKGADAVQTEQVLNEGVHGKAFALDGEGLYAETGYFGVGGNIPRTVAAWVRHRGPKLESSKAPGRMRKYSANELRRNDFARGAEVPQGQQAYLVGYTNAGLVSSKHAIGERIRAGVTYELELQAARVLNAGESSYRVELVALDPSVTDQQRGNCRSSKDAEREPGQGVVLTEARGSLEAPSPTVSAISPIKRVKLSFTATASNAQVGKLIGIRLLKDKGPVLYDNIRLTANPVGHPERARVLLAEDFESPRVNGFEVGSMPEFGWVRSNVGYGSGLQGLYRQHGTGGAFYVSWGGAESGRMWSLLVKGRSQLNWGVESGSCFMAADPSLESLPRDDWSHLAVVYTGRLNAQGDPEVLYYLNGDRVDRQPSTAAGVPSAPAVNTDISPDSASPLRFGAGPGDLSATVNGMLDDVYVIRGVLSQEKVRALMLGEGL